MTTLEEISSCPVMNHAFWTERARFHLAMAKENRNNPREFEAYRHAFIRAMGERREQKYFERLTANGAKAWADVPDAAAWVRELRGSDE
jgi:hypothetical protein